MPVDDATAVQVVRGELDADPVAGGHAEPVAAHLSGRVGDHRVPVVERDPEHAAAERLLNLAVHLDLLFGSDLVLLGVVVCATRTTGPRRAGYTVRTLIASGPFCPSRVSNSTCEFSASDLNPFPSMFEWWTNTSLPPSAGAMKP